MAKTSYRQHKVLAILTLMALFCINAMAQSLPTNIKDGVILHCFDWKYTDIQAELSNIKAAGFLTVQTSPAQANLTSQDSWNLLYRPRDSKAGPNVLGTATELKALCTAAHNMGMKVIVDVVANHTDGSLDWVADFWKNTDLYHDFNLGANDGSRYNVTHGHIGMHDLKTEDSRVQNKFKEYVAELKSLGVDGIRWDAAKHIGLPSEGDNFWAAVIDNTMYNYGEILNSCGGDENTHKACLREYTSYMSITDNVYSTNNVLAAFKNGNVPGTAGCWTFDTNNANFVYWGESHDTYCNFGDASNGVDQNIVDRAYAVAASHNAIPALYLSRPNGSGTGAVCGQKGSTHFTSSEVAEVNKFHNAMAGKADYYTAGNGVCSITRQNGGAIIVKGSGSGYVSVANGGGYATAGNYTDRISGNQFVVTATTITGMVGSSGIAVIYNGGDEPDPDPVTLPDCATWQNGTFCYFESSSWNSPMVWAWNGTGDSATNVYSSWPGSAADLTKVGTNNGNDVWLWKYSGNTPDMIIFNDGQASSTSKTGDLTFVNGGYYNQSGTLVGTVEKTTPTEATVAADKATGSYSNSVTVNLTASDGTSTIVYTTDGTTPTTTSSQATGSKQFTFTETTTLTAGVIVDGTVKNIVAYTYTITKESFELPECATWQNGTFCYLETSWTNPTVWAWTDAINGDVFLGTSWPGVAMESVGTNNGKNVYRWTWAGTTAPTKIIFSNNGSNQTDDLDFTNGGYYVDGVVKGTVEKPQVEEVTLAVDKEAGSYEESVTVTLTASNTNATIVYTTDGSAPTATSSQATGSKQFTFTETTTLRAAALVNGELQNAVSYTYTITKTEPDPIVITDITTLSDAIYNDATTVVSGTESVLAVNMKNESAVTMLQFDITLPEGVSIAVDESNKAKIELTSRKNTDHSVESNFRENTYYTVLVKSALNKYLSGNDGAIVNITLNVDDTVEPGSYVIKYDNIVFNTKVNSQNTAVEVGTIYSALEVTDVAMGDVNGDGKVNITDSSTLISYLLGESPSPFNTTAADVNGDGRIGITDAVLINDMIIKNNQ